MKQLVIKPRYFPMPLRDIPNGLCMRGSELCIKAGNDLDGFQLIGSKEGGFLGYDESLNVIPCEAQIIDCYCDER